MGPFKSFCLAAMSCCFQKLVKEKKAVSWALPIVKIENGFSEVRGKGRSSQVFVPLGGLRAPLLVKEAMCAIP